MDNDVVDLVYDQLDALTQACDDVGGLVIGVDQVQQWIADTQALLPGRGKRG